jgi:hypothetical protein
MEQDASSGAVHELSQHGGATMGEQGSQTSLPNSTAEI